jgi:pimeloyl-ACP methyl ester carboxylesterase
MNRRDFGVMAATGFGTAVLPATGHAASRGGGAMEKAKRRHILRKGVRLAYVEAGQGEQSILLVHGMMCNYTHMRFLFDHFAPRYRVVAVDLRGHGASDKPHSSYTDEEFHDDLTAVGKELGLVKPIGIGHSFGGSTLLHMAVARPGSLGGLVILDSGIRSASSRAGELKSVYEDPKPDVLKKFMADRLFGPDDPQGLKDEVLAEMFTMPDHALTAMQKTVLAFDGARAAEECKLPSLFILAEKPFTDEATLARLGPNWRISRVVGSGHFIQLVVPAQVNAMVDRFFEVAKFV